MGEVLRWSALILTALLLTRVAPREFAVLVTLGACVLVLYGVAEFLEPMVGLLKELRELANLGGQALSILLKASGIGLLSQIVGLLCADAGEGALAKVLETASSMAILWLGLPIFQEILDILHGIIRGF